MVIQYYWYAKKNKACKYARNMQNMQIMSFYRYSWKYAGYVACNVHNMQNMTKHMLDTARNMALNMQNIHLSPMRKITFQAMFSKKIVGCADFQVMIGWKWGRWGREEQHCFVFGVNHGAGRLCTSLQAHLARPIGQTHRPDPTKPLPHDPLSPCHMTLPI